MRPARVIAPTTLTLAVLLAACNGSATPPTDPASKPPSTATRSAPPSASKPTPTTPTTQSADPSNATPPTDPASKPPSTATQSAPPSASKPTSPTASTQSEDPSNATETLALRDQIDLQVGGDGLFLSCQNDVEGWQEPPAPAVWLNSLFSATEYPGNVVLCLKGFQPGQPIAVTTTVGSTERTMEVNPVSGPPITDQNFLYEALPSETLFDDRDFEVYTEVSEGVAVDDRSGELLISETWTFLPPAEIRNALARTAMFTLTARQGEIEAMTEQPIQTPTTPEHQVLERTGLEEARRAVIYGYPVGATVPIGLYRRDQRSSEQATLVDTLATVKVPASRIAEVALEERVRDRGEGFYCVAPPVASAVDCAAVEIWPNYPGAIAQGDRSTVVREWQRILIQAAIISDKDANRDGFFGEATARAVNSYLENQGIPNPDGENVLARGMYKLITG
jgi:hypothetical protein